MGEDVQMKGKYLFSSFFTIAIMVSFVFFVLLLVAFSLDIINIQILIILTIIINFIVWLVNPLIMDFTQRIFYNLKVVSFNEFLRDYPHLGEFLKEICSEHKIKIPALRIIRDNNPTAYCYGSYPNNSRVVFSEGIFKYLDLEEQKAVLAHEMGHIINKDFIIMSVANTLLQILYEIYYFIMRRSRRRNSGSSSSKSSGNNLFIIAVVSYIFWYIGTYLILYLSRTREYLADRFSADKTGNPDALSDALIKIAYGIAAEEESEETEHLLHATRSMGIFDFKSAHGIGKAFSRVKDTSIKNTNSIINMFLFDIYSPWAFFAEIKSSHPLIGKRVKMMSKLAKKRNYKSKYDWDEVRYRGGQLDHTRLKKGFLSGLFISYLPSITIVGGLLMLVVYGTNYYPLVLTYVGLAQLIKGIYSFQLKSSGPEKTDVFHLMQDPYLNPVKGKYVSMDGKIIGKGEAGNYFDQNLKMQDDSGGLVYLNYKAIVPGIGDLIFAFTTARQLIGRGVKTVGWFRRSSYTVLDLHFMEDGVKKIQSYTRFWRLITGGLLLLVGLVFMYFLPG